jgi:hypothetical protein
MPLVQNECPEGLRPDRDSSKLSKYWLNAENGAKKLFIDRGLAPRHGFEPRFTAPKAAVLPLDDRGMRAGQLCSTATGSVYRKAESAARGEMAGRAGIDVNSCGVPPLIGL